MLLWIEFIICTSVIVYSGIKLSKYGDVIAEKTGLGRTWIGVVLMASVTSLPELVTGISSVAVVGVPDIAVGDVLGSCVFNMAILAFLDAAHKEMPISAKAHHGNVLSAGFGILLLSVIAMGLFLKETAISFGWVGLYSMVVLITYVIAVKLLFSYEKRRVAVLLEEGAEKLKYENIPLGTAVVNYGINAAIVVAAAVFLPKIGLGIAQTTGLGQTFVGNIFIAMATSLPEVVVSLAAVRMNAVDLAIGSLLGSNIFNILILAVDDILFFKGPLLSFASQTHLISALSAISMTTVAIIGLTYRAEKKFLLLAWDSLAILLIYCFNLALLYLLR